jgi:homopolymeric O-antigen transport system permease protein
VSSPAAPTSLETGAPVPRAVLRDVRLGPTAMLISTWNHRALIPRIGIRAIVKGYSGAKLGRFWIFARPALNVFGMSLLFGAVLNVPSGGVPYILFLLVGLLAWMSFERFAFWATRSFDIYRRLARSLNFPLLLIPTASGMAATVEFCVISSFIVGASLVYLAIDGVLYIQIGLPSLLAIPGLALCVAHAWAIGLWTSALNARARDVRIVFRYVLMLWMYLTPVLYAPSTLPAGLDVVAKVNPITAPVETVKYALLDAGTVKASSVAISVGWLLVVAASGLWFFSRMAPSLMRVQPPGVDEEDEL